MDAGCAPGALSIKLAKKFRNVVSYDYIPNFIEMLNERKSSNI